MARSAVPKIDPEFHGLIPALSADESAQLESSLLAEGCRDALVVWGDTLIDGHNRLEICRRHNIPFNVIKREFETREDALVWIYDTQLGRRNLTPMARIELALGKKDALAAKAKAKQLSTLKQGDQPPVHQNSDEREAINTLQEVAKTAGVSHDTVHKVQTIQKKAPESVKVAVRAGSISINAAYKEVKKEEKKQANEAVRLKLAEIGSGVQLDESRVQIVHADFRDYLKTLDDNSVDLIFTDPPYDKKSIPLYADLALHAARILKPGGRLLTYVGHYALPEVAQTIAAHLRYWWLIALSHQSGNHRRLQGTMVYVHWKPMLWFVKGTYRGQRAVADLIETDQPDKQAHDWEQGILPAKYYIDYLTEPGDLVVDPMCGSGTTCLAALESGRRALGIEIDRQRANIAREKVHGL